MSIKFLWIFPSWPLQENNVKTRFQNRGSAWYFLSSRDQKIKNWTKIEQKRLILFAFLALFFMAFLAQTDLRNKYMIHVCAWLIFWTRPSFKLNYFRSLCEKMYFFKTETDVAQNLIDEFFSNFDLQRTFL